MRRPNPTLSARLSRIYPAALVLGAILTHLASEFFGMGADADGAILFSPRHAYLALVAIACALFLAFQLRAILRDKAGALDLRRQLSLELRHLPMRGDWRFYALSAVAQFALGVGSAVGEGCFFCGHDAFFGVAGALATAALLALAGRLLTARLPRLAAEICARMSPDTAPARALCLEPSLSFSPRSVFWSPQLANRPPPLLS